MAKDVICGLVKLSSIAWATFLLARMIHNLCCKRNDFVI